MSRPIHAQRGAILVLTAFLLPFIIAFTGLAVDFGNLYVQHQKMQNAADAAALAGAYNFKAENTTDMSAARVNADKAATDNGNINCGGSMTDAEVRMDTNVDNTQNPAYYGVKMTKTVPVYFLSFVPEIGNTQDVNAVATVKINPTVEEKDDSDALVDSLAIYSDYFDATQELNNPDDNSLGTVYHNITATFDGKITYTGSGSNVNASGFVYNNKKYFFTKKAQDDGRPIKEIVNKKQGEYWDTVHSATFNYTENTITKAFADKKRWMGVYNALNNRVAWGDGILNVLFDRVIHLSGQEIYIDGNSLVWNGLFGVSNKDIPVYIEVDQLTNIHLESDTVRPIFIYAKNDSGWGGNVNLDLQGHNFRGIIYAPTSSFIVNLNNDTFQGSVIAKNVSFHGQGHYIYEGFNETGKAHTSSSGSGGITQDSGDVSLVSNDKISWENK